MPETQPSIFDEKESFMLPPRRALLPWWIIFFSWFTFVVSFLNFTGVFIQFFGIKTPGLTALGLQAKKELPLKDVIDLIMLIYASIVAYGLLKEKNWAVKVAIVYVFVSAAHSVYTIIVDKAERADPAGAAIFWIFISFSYLILALFLWKLFTIRKEWSIRQSRNSL